MKVTRGFSGNNHDFSMAMYRRVTNRLILQKMLAGT
jgi:hypothetical protein